MSVCSSALLRFVSFCFLGFAVLFSKQNSFDRVSVWLIRKFLKLIYLTSSHKPYHKVSRLDARKLVTMLPQRFTQINVKE